MYPHLSGEEAEIGLVLFDSNAEVGPLQPLGIWGETRTPGLFFFVFLCFLPCAQPQSWKASSIRASVSAFGKRLRVRKGGRLTLWEWLGDGFSFVTDLLHSPGQEAIFF